MREAGLHVALEDARGRPAERLPDVVGAAAYRIVQESLTNVVRHAHVGTCRVRIDYGPSDVAIEVTDDGRGGPVRGTGHGLIGMRERVRALGGSFEAGPRAAGGFRVAVRLPA